MKKHKNNYAQGISSTTVFLERFFENLLFQGKNELKNRLCHILWKDDGKRQSANPQCKSCTLEEPAVLKFLTQEKMNAKKTLSYSLER